MAWISFTNVTANGWTDAANAIDGNTGTNATLNHGRNVWGAYLVAGIAATDATGVRVYADRVNAQISLMQIDVFYGGAWHSVYDGNAVGGAYVTDDGWSETESVTQLRVRFYSTQNNREAYVHSMELFEYEEPTEDYDGASGEAVTVSVSGKGSKSSSGASSATMTVETSGAGQKAVSGANGEAVAVTAAGAGQALESEDYEGASSISVSVSAAGTGNKSTDGAAGASTSTETGSDGVKESSDATGHTVTISPGGTGNKSASGGKGETVSITVQSSGRIDSDDLDDASFETVLVSADAAGQKDARGPPTVNGIEVTVAGVGIAEEEAEAGIGASNESVTVSAAGSGTKHINGASADGASVEFGSSGTKVASGTSTASIDVSVSGSGMIITGKFYVCRVSHEERLPSLSNSERLTDAWTSEREPSSLSIQRKTTADHTERKVDLIVKK